MEGERRQQKAGRCESGHSSRAGLTSFAVAIVAALAALPGWVGAGSASLAAADSAAAPETGVSVSSSDEDALKPSDPQAEVGIAGDASSEVSEPPLLTADPGVVGEEQAQAEATSDYRASAEPNGHTQIEQRARTLSASEAPGVDNPLISPGIDAVDGGGTAPADAAGAVGASYYLEAVNNRIAVYDQSDLGEVASKGLAGFVGAPGDVVTEPQLLRDDVHGRWYYAARRLAANGDVFIAFGWSKGGNPANLDDGWCNFFVRTDDPNDFPRLGQDTNRIVIGSNSYQGPGPQAGSFLTAKIRAIPKPGDNQTSCDRPSIDSYGSASAPLQEPDGDLAFTPVPAQTLNDKVTDYIVSDDIFDTRDQLNLWSLTGPKSAPVLAAKPSISVTPYEIPPMVPQPGTNLGLYALDTRLTQAVSQGDPTDGDLQAVWTQHTVRDVGGGMAEVRWYEIVPQDPNGRLRQAGSISSPSLHVFNGAIAPTRQGNGAIIQYDTGNGSSLATLKASSRGPTTPLNQMDSALALRASADPLTDSVSCRGVLVGCRWGDYASMSTDMYQDNTVWGSSELSGPSGPVPQWITKNFELQR